LYSETFFDSTGGTHVEYYCLTCRHVFAPGQELCGHLQQLFTSVQGEKIWRIRFLHRFAYEFYSDGQIQELIRDQPLMVSEVLCVDQFDTRTHTGLNAIGQRVSIFE
jgi:hypothetical protein